MIEPRVPSGIPNLRDMKYTTREDGTIPLRKFVQRSRDGVGMLLTYLANESKKKRPQSRSRVWRDLVDSWIQLVFFSGFFTCDGRAGGSFSSWVSSRNGCCSSSAWSCVLD